MIEYLELISLFLFNLRDNTWVQREKENFSESCSAIRKSVTTFNSFAHCCEIVTVQ